MRKFSIKVNGNSYEVEVEEIKNTQEVVANSPEPFAKIAEAPKPKTAAPTVDVPQNAVKVTAPMPGTILGVKVNVGDKVTEGAVLCVLEAMKMENEIVSPRAGTVLSVNVSKGSPVKNGDLLISIG